MPQVVKAQFQPGRFLCLLEVVDVEARLGQRLAGGVREDQSVTTGPGVALQSEPRISAVMFEIVIERTEADVFGSVRWNVPSAPRTS